MILTNLGPLMISLNIFWFGLDFSEIFEKTKKLHGASVLWQWHRRFRFFLMCSSEVSLTSLGFLWHNCTFLSCPRAAFKGIIHRIKDDGMKKYSSVPFSSSSLSSIAAMKNFLADRRLTQLSSPPTPTPSGAPSDHPFSPCPAGRWKWGWSEGAPGQYQCSQHYYCGRNAILT